MEKYYFQTEKETLEPIESCEFTHKKIGCVECSQCDNCFGYDVEERWVKCKIYSIIQENKNLETENNSLKNICDEFNELLHEQGSHIANLERQLNEGGL